MLVDKCRAKGVDDRNVDDHYKFVVLFQSPIWKCTCNSSRTWTQFFDAKYHSLLVKFGSLSESTDWKKRLLNNLWSGFLVWRKFYGARILSTLFEMIIICCLSCHVHHFWTSRVFNFVTNPCLVLRRFLAFLSVRWLCHLALVLRCCYCCVSTLGHNPVILYSMVANTIPARIYVLSVFSFQRLAAFYSTNYNAHRFYKSDILVSISLKSLRIIFKSRMIITISSENPICSIWNRKSLISYRVTWASSSSF